ncbi:hypothetical protein FOZ62_024647 [Perkinsus olseni]|uniref:Uncharacterized protein n=2 Tax=Perkinsus olseni TaxID=32597 RepID=A0A7J6UAE0_PEROL|nr:hypothetical protein FOZ62_024647 [Perkinsus olseni]
MSFSCFGTGATSEDGTTLGYNKASYQQQQQQQSGGQHHESRMPRNTRRLSKLEQLASAEACVFDVYSDICLKECKLGIGETHWRRLLKKAGVLDFVGSSVATNVHYRSLLPGGMRRLRLEGFQKAIAMIANYCYPIQQQGGEQHGGSSSSSSRTLVDTYIHFVWKHLRPLVGTWKIGSAETMHHHHPSAPPSFDECDIAADLIKEWRHNRASTTFVTSVDAVPERVNRTAHASRRHSAGQQTGVIAGKGEVNVRERQRAVDAGPFVAAFDHDPPATGDDTAAHEAPRRAVTPMRFGGKALLAAAKWRKRKHQKGATPKDEANDVIQTAGLVSTMSKEKGREFYLWLKEVYEYTVAFEDWIKDLSPIHDAYDYLDKACGTPSGRVTLNKLQAAARTAKFTLSTDAVNILFYFLDIHGVGCVTRPAFEQWRTVRQNTIDSYMALS